LSSEIKLSVKGRQASAYLAEGNGGPGILVLHAWWGLNPFFKEVCDQLAAQGFTALAPDLYQGRIANTIDEAQALLENRDSQFMGDIVKAAKDHLAALHAGRPMGVIGFSMGASWALVLAASEPDIAAAVLFYGSDGVDFSKTKAKILGHFAQEDDWEPLDGIKAMEMDMKAAGLDVTIHTYPKAGHWFVENDRPEYDAASALLAWSRTFEFLGKNLSS
jgi:carboxymethylenebutenolidase